MLRRLVSPLLSHGVRRAVPLHSAFASSFFHFSFSSDTAKPCPPGESETNESSQNTQPTGTISVDRSGLCNPPDHFHDPATDTEMVKHLKSIIKFRGGPISIAEYMEEVLTNPNHGFYINKDVFGAAGDFVTSPEVSQMFGEMVGVWAMCLWEQLGQPVQLNLVELGPGRGTLLADLLRGSSKFVDFAKSLHIHLIECSPTLQKLQYNTLKCIDDTIPKNDAATRIATTLTGSPISWHADLEEVPSGENFSWVVRKDDRCIRGFIRLCQWVDKEAITKLEQIEACPRAMELTHQIAKRISIDGGGALIIDYGKDGTISDSLQAIKKHKFVHVLDNPGSADLSAYVDFSALRHCAEATSENIAVHGPITQSQLLVSLGINFRVDALLQSCSEQQAESLRIGYWRLVGDGEAPFWEGPPEQAPLGMGTRYLAMAIVNKKQGVPVPFQ